MNSYWTGFLAIISILGWLVTLFSVARQTAVEFEAKRINNGWFFLASTCFVVAIPLVAVSLAVMR